MSTQTTQQAAVPATTAASPQKKELSPQGQLVVARKNRIQAMLPEFARAMGDMKAADRFVRTVLTAIQMNPQIAEASESSVINACMKAATDGLILDGREAALTLYNTNKGTKENPKWVKEAQYIPMVTGIIKRVRNSGEVSRFNAFVHHKNDKLTIKYGLDPSLDHEPNFTDPGEIMGAYAVCRFSDGLDDFEYMSKGQIDAIRARSKSPDRGPWKTDYEEMCKKTVMRRLSKRLPMSSDLRNVIQRVDELYDMDNENETIDHSTGEIVETTKPKRAYNKKAGAAADKMAQASQETAPATQEQEVMQGDQSHVHPGPSDTVIDAEYEETEGGDNQPQDII